MDDPGKLFCPKGVYKPLSDLSGVSTPRLVPEARFSDKKFVSNTGIATLQLGLSKADTSTTSAPNSTTTAKENSETKHAQENTIIAKETNTLSNNSVNDQVMSNGSGSSDTNYMVSSEATVTEFRDQKYGGPPQSVTSQVRENDEKRSEQEQENYVDKKESNDRGNSSNDTGIAVSGSVNKKEICGDIEVSTNEGIFDTDTGGMRNVVEVTEVEDTINPEIEDTEETNHANACEGSEDIQIQEKITISKEKDSVQHLDVIPDDGNVESVGASNASLDDTLDSHGNDQSQTEDGNDEGGRLNSINEITDFKDNDLDQSTKEDELGTSWRANSVYEMTEFKDRSSAASQGMPSEKADEDLQVERLDRSRSESTSSNDIASHSNPVCDILPHDERNVDKSPESIEPPTDIALVEDLSTERKDESIRGKTSMDSGQDEGFMNRDTEVTTFTDEARRGSDTVLTAALPAKDMASEAQPPSKSDMEKTVEDSGLLNDATESTDFSDDRATSEKAAAVVFIGASSKDSPLSVDADEKGTSSQAAEIIDADSCADNSVRPTESTSVVDHYSDNDTPEKNDKVTREKDHVLVPVTDGNDIQNSSSSFTQPPLSEYCVQESANPPAPDEFSATQATTTSTNTNGDYSVVIDDIELETTDPKKYTTRTTPKVSFSIGEEDMKNGPIENVGIVNKSYDQDEDGEETRLINYLDDNVPGELVDEEKLIAASTGTGYVVKRNTSLESVAVSLQELNTETPQPDAFNVESDKEKILDKELHSHNDDVEKGILKEPKQSDHDKPHSSTNDLVKTKSSKGCSLCATIIIALLCILLGIAIGYLIFSVVGDNAPITPAPESTTATSASSSTMTPSTTLPSTLSTSPTNPTPDGSTSDGQVTTAPPSTTPGAVTSDSTGEFTTGVLVSSSDSSLTSETTISSTTIAQSTISSGTFTSDSTDGLTTEQSTTETSSMIISSEPTEETTLTPSTTSSIAVTSDSTESQTTSFTTEDASSPASTEPSIGITTQETTKESITSAGETTFETTTFVPEATTEILCGCECSRNYWLPGCNDRNGTICDKVGERMPESNDCADFAECSDSGSGNVEYETKQCPPGTVYNAATWTCIDEALLYCSSSANETSSGVCASSPCLNGGTCIEYTDGTYGCVCQIDCSCQLGKVGDNCENAFDTDDTAGRVRICAGVDSGAVFPYAPRCDAYWFCPLFVGDPALLRFCHVIQPNDCPNEGDCYFVSELGRCVPKSPLPNDCLPPPFLPGQPAQSTESSQISSTDSRTSMFFTTESPTIEVTSDLQMTTANDLSTELNCGCQCSRDSWTSGCEPRDGQQCEVEGTRVQESELCGEFAQCVDVGGTQTYQYETRSCPAGQVYDQVSWRCIDEDLPFCNSQNNDTAVPSACASNPCQNNGTCVDYTDGTYGCVCRIACSCLLGKVGDNCENAFDEDDVTSRIRICDQQAAGTTFPYALRGDAFWICPFISGDPAILVTCTQFDGRECPSEGDCYYVPDLRICLPKSPLPNDCQPPTK